MRWEWIRKMHICHITSMHRWDDDRIYERAACCLARNGHTVSVIAARSSSESINGVEILAVSPRSGWRRRIFCSRDAWRLARSLGADIYHFHDPDLLPWMLHLKSLGYRIVYDSHENFIVRFYQWRLPNTVRGPLARAFRWFERWAVERFDGVVTPDAHIFELFSDICRDGAVVRNTHDIQRLDNNVIKHKKDPVPVLYTSGSNLPDRNCDEMILAMPLILREIPEARLRYAGFYGTDYRKHLAELAEKQGVKDRVEFLEARPYFEHFSRSFAATVGCVFLKDSPKNRHANSNRLFEYMYCGLPVLAEDLPGPRSVVQAANCGIVIDSSRPEAIAEAFVHLARNPALCEEYGINGQRAVRENYNYASDLEELESLYRRILPGQETEFQDNERRDP